MVATPKSIADIGRKTKPTQSDAVVTRRAWAATWAARIGDMLDAPMRKATPGRIFRLRYFQDNDYVVATLVQNAMPEKVLATAVRGYHRAPGSCVVQLPLHSLDFGKYCTDDVVAFLRLDVVDPDTAAWQDETHYRDILVPTTDVVQRIVQGVH